MRLLLVQFNSDFLANAENPDAEKYYDKLYRTLPGYNRFGPTWEIPVWIGKMKRNFPDADILFVDNMAKFWDKMPNYTHIAFSALDCNVYLIRWIADKFDGTIIVGGYCDCHNLTDLQNVFWFDSVQACCFQFGQQYRTGVDYSAFAGAKTIGRLTLSAGCSHKCKFCTVPDEVVKTPADEVYQAADEICRLNSPLVYIDDKTFGQCENFWMLPTLFKYFADNMSAGFVTGFVIQTTARQLLKMDDDFLLASGIRYVELGVETYNDAILADMNKPATEKVINAATEKLRRLGIKLIPNIIIGLPGESLRTYSNTLDWLRANRDAISHVNVYSLAIYADCELDNDLSFAGNQIDENRLPAGRAESAFAKRIYQFGLECLGSDQTATATYTIEYERQDKNRTKGKTTFTSHAAIGFDVVHEFESKFLYYLKVTSCELRQ